MIEEMTHFARLGLENTFNIETELLSKHYLNLQRQFHPDKYVTKSAHEYRLSLEYITAINQAYEIIKSPLARAIYLLELNKIEIKPNQQILIEIMNLNEQLIELTTQDELEEFRHHLKFEQDKTLQNLSQAFEQNNLLQAAVDTIKLKYFSKLEDEAEGKKI